MFALTGVPLSLLGMAYVLAVLYVGGLLSLTVIGLPVLALGLAGARHLGRGHVRLMRTLLGEGIDPPAPPAAAPGVLPWIRSHLSDVTAWRSVLYLTLRLPLDLVAFVLTVALPAFGVWSIVWTVIGSPPLWLAVTAVVGGLAALAVAPVAARTMMRAHRLLGRKLLGPSASQLRVKTLERARTLAFAEGARDLRQVERDLHDGTQAQLVAIAMTLSLATDALGDEPSPGRTGALVARARAQTDTAIAELRRLIDGMSPAALDRGLADALPQLTGQAKVPVALTVEMSQRPDPVIERVAYFCVAELLTNVSKHSGATKASVDARVIGKVLRIQVRDDGGGGAGIGAGSGLPGLRERLTAVDGTLALHSPPGGPTTVVLEMPVRI
ncbi:sensor domain-containing protein [Streptomyces sp. NBC_00704]|uniref:sensor histidine kinase n=1 Tax=Streptomyces sp. NBC_00704 TaxID=2975809 RepID=UPI002E325588|nr:sensor domain-containing protein [Streptomyces sp. NBC_00704]